MATKYSAGKPRRKPRFRGGVPGALKVNVPEVGRVANRFIALEFQASIGPKVLRKSVTSGIDPKFIGPIRSARKTFEFVNKKVSEIVNFGNIIDLETMRYLMEPIYKKSQEWVPVDTGAMKASGFLHVDRESFNRPLVRGLKTLSTRRRLMVQIGYGLNGIPPYTALQHENSLFEHNPPTRAFWLSEALVWGLEKLSDGIVREAKSRSEARMQKALAKEADLKRQLKHRNKLREAKMRKIGR